MSQVLTPRLFFAAPTPVLCFMNGVPWSADTRPDGETHIQCLAAGFALFCFSVPGNQTRGLALVR